MSHMRSSSVSGKTRLLGADGGGVLAQASIVERTESYFFACSAVRTGAGGAFDDEEGWRKGVFNTVEEGLLAGSSDGTNLVGSVSGCGRAPLGAGEFAACIIDKNCCFHLLQLLDLDMACEV